jgi:hypothetical protein
VDRFSRKRTTSIPLLKVKVDKTFKNVRFLPHLQASSAAGQSNVCKIWRFLHFPRRPIESADRLLSAKLSKTTTFHRFQEDRKRKNLPKELQMSHPRDTMETR